jgi:uncharacterized phage protein (TIGR01671 family)
MAEGKRFQFRVWHKKKDHMYKNVAVGVGESKVGYKMSGRKRYVWERTEDVVINQYTGYKDSKGNEIFEGDILKFGKSRPYLATVHWIDYQFVFKKKGSSSYTDKFTHWGRVNNVEVLGNIYENPELLKSKKEV